MPNRIYAVRHIVHPGEELQRAQPLLRHLDIELTERCNNACLHCAINRPADDHQAMQQELTTDEWKEILRQAADLGALSVRFTGGEPLLREDFAELYLFARRLGLRVYIFTNARLITQELADLLCRVRPLEAVEITVYGMHPTSYDAVSCAPGSYLEFRRGVDLLWQRQVPFVVKSAILPQNKMDMAEFEAWASTIPWMDNPPSYAMFFDLRGRRDSPTRNRLITSLRPSPQESLDVLTRRPDDYRIAMAHFCSTFIGPPGARLFGCGAGHGGCVDAYGNYQMCLLLRHPAFVHNLRGGSLYEALTDLFPRLRQAQASNPEYLARCARCFLKGLCEQCPAKSWVEHGTLDTPVEYLCLIAHAQARYLGLLNDGERAWEIDNWRRRVASFVAASTTSSGGS